MNVKWVKRFIYALIACTGLLLLLFSVLSFDQTLAANGKIVADEKLIFMQASRTGTIKKIFVKRGDFVKKDQLLLALDNTLHSLQTHKMAAELAILQEKWQRFHGQLIFLKEQKLPQSTDYDQSPLKSLLLQIKDREAHIISLQQEQSLAAEHLQLLKAQSKDAEKLNQMYEKLYLKKFVSLQQLLSSRQQLRLERIELIAKKIAYHQLSANIAEKIAQLKEFKSEHIADIQQTLLDLQQQEQQLQANLATSRYLEQQSALPAPISGYILAITELAPGSSLASGQTYIQIAPLAALQYAEVYLTSDQIGWIKQKQSATLTLNALSNHQQVDLTATVINVAPQPTKIKINDYYIVQIKIPQEQLKKLPAHFNLQAGMQVRVYFNVGKTRLMNYFIYPLMQQIKEL